MGSIARGAMLAFLICTAAGHSAAQPAAAPATAAPVEAPVPPSDDPATAHADAPLPARGASTPGDPFEKLNRGIWSVNRVLDRFIVKPVATVYRAVLPRPIRRGVSHAISNLSEPWSFVNNLLQAKPGRAVRNLGRFVLNSTVGVAGLIDQATPIGLKPAPEDFGQTLAAWGIKSSAYLVLPLLGPSTVRDGFGSGVAMVADPYRICLRECTGLSGTEILAINAFTVVSARSDLVDSGADTFLETSLDPYAAARSAYLQRRAAALADDDGDVGTPAPGLDTSIDPTSATVTADEPAAAGDVAPQPGLEAVPPAAATSGEPPAPEAPVTQP